MNYLVPVTVAILITLVVVSGRSTYHSGSAEKKLDSEDNRKVIIKREVPNMTADTETGEKGEILLTATKNLTSADEAVNVVGDEGMPSSSAKGEEPAPYSIVVPIARNFSSLKELFEIVGKDSKSQKEGSADDQAFVKGTEDDASDYVIFFTS